MKLTKYNPTTSSTTSSSSSSSLSPIQISIVSSWRPCRAAQSKNVCYFRVCTLGVQFAVVLCVARSLIDICAYFVGHANLFSFGCCWWWWFGWARVRIARQTECVCFCVYALCVSSFVYMCALSISAIVRNVCECVCDVGGDCLGSVFGMCLKPN